MSTFTNLPSRRALQVLALLPVFASCQATELAKHGNLEGSHLRLVRTTPEYRDTLVVAAMGSSVGSCFDAERLWSKETDWEPAVAVAPDTGHVYQLTTRWAWGGKPDPAVFVRRSIDQGDTWEKDQQIYPSGKKGQQDPIIEAVAGGIVIAAWLDDSKTLVSRSDDHGVTWSKPVAIGASSTDFPRLAVSPDGKHVYVAFNGGSCEVSASHDGGASFANAVTAGSGGGTWFPAGAEIAPNGDVYFSASVLGSSSSIQVVRSVNGGASWASRVIDTTVSRSQFYLDSSAGMTIDQAGTLMVAYNKGTASEHRMYVSTSPDGVAWSAPIPISTAGSGTDHAFPAVGAGPAPGDFRVVWQDNRNGGNGWNTWLRRTTDGGKTWEDEIRVSDQTSGANYKNAAGYGSPYGDYLELEVDPSGWNHIVWGAGPSWSGYGGGIWYTRGIQVAGTGRFIGTSCKHSQYPASAFGPSPAGTIPYIGEPFELAATQLPPTSTTFSAIGLMGFREHTTPLDLSVTGLFLPNCLLHVDFSIQAPLARDPSNPATATWPLPIPCDHGLVGLDFHAQAAIIDSANPNSWMLTNAYAGKIGAR